MARKNLAQVTTPAPPCEAQVAPEQAALDAAGGDVAAAVELLAAEVAADAALVDRLLPEMIRLWARNRIHDLVAARRTAIVRAALPENARRTAQRLQGAAANEARRLLDFPIWGGKRLADATPDEVRESARLYAEKADDMGRKARWQMAVADAAAKKGSGPISRHLSEAQVARLWDTSDA